MPEELGAREFLSRKICMSDLGKIWYNMHAHMDNVFQCDVDEPGDARVRLKLRCVLPLAHV